MSSKLLILGSQKETVLVSNGGDPYWDKVLLLLRTELTVPAQDGGVVGVYEYSNYERIDNNTTNGVSSLAPVDIGAKFGSSTLFFQSIGQTSTSARSFNYGPSTDFDLTNSDCTIEFWVDFLAYNQSEYIFRIGDPSMAGNDVSVGRNSSGTIFSNAGGGGSPNNNSWIHIALVKTGNLFKLYVNGVFQNQASSSTYNSTPYLTIGAPTGAVGASAQRFLGYIEEFRFTKGIARYTANFSPPTDIFPTWKDGYPKPITGIIFSIYRKTSNTGGVTVTAGTWTDSASLTYQWQKHDGYGFKDLPGENSLTLIGTYYVGAYRLKETATSGSLISKQYSGQLRIYSGGL